MQHPQNTLQPYETQVVSIICALSMLPTGCFGGVLHGLAGVSLLAAIEFGCAVARTQQFCCLHTCRQQPLRGLVPSPMHLTADRKFSDLHSMPLAMADPVRQDSATTCHHSLVAQSCPAGSCHGQCHHPESILSCDDLPQALLDSMKHVLAATQSNPSAHTARVLHHEP